jgi:hypothetical protein
VQEWLIVIYIFTPNQKLQNGSDTGFMKLFNFNCLEVALLTQGCFVDCSQSRRFLPWSA